MVDAPDGTPTTALRIGTAPVNWNNTDIPNWRPLTPFPDILDRMREAGYTATEYNPAFGTDPEALNREMRQRGMTWTGSYQWVDFLDVDAFTDALTAFDPVFALLNAIDCRHLIVADSLRPHRVALAGRVPADGSESLPESKVRLMADNIHRLAGVAARHGIATHFHNHVGTWIEHPREVDALISLLDPTIADLCFDTGHYAYGGGDPARFIADHLDLIGYLHLKDVDTRAVEDARARELTFLEALREIVFSPLGQGAADIPSILHRLVDGRFSGWVIIEQDTSAGDETATARDNLRYITDWLSEHAPDAAPRR